MKDPCLRVVYHRGEDGQLYVFMYRGELHIGTVQVGYVLCDLEKIAGSLSRLEKIGYDLGKVAEHLCCFLSIVKRGEPE